MIEQLFIVPILLFSVIVHEYAHGWMALKLGDPTARDMGRLTFNPVPHIDLMGSILVPLFSLAVAGRVFIAWAKPVPVNQLNFAQMKRDDVLVSIAGPLSNIAVAFGCSVAVIFVGLCARSVEGTSAPLLDEALSFLLKMFYGGILLNIVLALFNLIPVPPLDGSHILASVLPEGLARAYSRLGFLGVFFVIALMRVSAFSEAFGSVIGWVFVPFKGLIEAFL